jgi:cytosine/adenosine deaminase-related metal-dependent hydrolase
MATLDGAHVVGLEDRTGSLTPGKQADVVMIDGRGPGVTPVIDPVGAVVLSADTANVDTVIVGGKVRKRGGKLTGDWESARRAVQASSEHLQQALERKKAEAQAASG